MPPTGANLRIVVHPAALKALGSQHTQLAGFVGTDLVWLGAMGEDLLVPVQGPLDPDARSACARRILAGGRLWEIVRPGLLVSAGVPRPVSTVYDGGVRRPWVIIGETSGGAPIAVPLNEATNPKWYAPKIPQAEMNFPGNAKDSQVELAHA